MENRLQQLYTLPYYKPIDNLMFDDDYQIDIETGLYPGKKKNLDMFLEKIPRHFSCKIFFRAQT